MADEISGSMDIGGRLTWTQWMRKVELEGLLDFLSPATGRSRDDSIVDLSHGTISLNDPCAAYGHFDELESYLRDQCIPYDRHADARYEYDGEEASFRAGMEGELIATATQDGIITVSASLVARYINDGTTLAEMLAVESDDETAGLRLTILRQAHPLPDFEFVEEGLDD